MPTERITFLLRKKLDKTASDAENAELANLFLLADPSDINAALKPLWEEYKTTLLMPTETSDEILAKILATQNKIHPLPRKNTLQRNLIRYAVAAVFMGLLTGVSYLYFFKNDAEQKTIVQYKGDVAPGKEGAKLTLSNGRTILIDSIQDGLVAEDQHVKIFKKDGKLQYKGSSTEVVYNVITTERGRQWSAILPDGTVAWLNASSSLRYPLKFSANERVVDMTGEAAFKVVHNAAKPFRVKVGKQVIEDIGTEFNVKAYDDEQEIKTTLIEGSASISAKGKKLVVTAGQLSTINNLTQENIISEADMDEATAWRRGLFSFKDANIQKVMKELSRWYDVEVVYEGNVSALADFTGKMGRSLTLAQAFKVLSVMRVHYRIEEDKRIVVMP